MRLAMPSSLHDTDAAASAARGREDRMRVQDRTRAAGGHNVFFHPNPIDRRRPFRAPAAFLFGAPRPAWSDKNDHATVARHPAPGRDTGPRQQGKPQRGKEGKAYG